MTTTRTLVSSTLLCIRLCPRVCLDFICSARVVIDRTTGEAGAVDPVEPAKVLAAAETHHARITTILTTHQVSCAVSATLGADFSCHQMLRFVLVPPQHMDHAGGNLDLIAKLPGGTVVVGGLGE
jgi:hypothetical protein